MHARPAQDLRPMAHAHLSHRDVKGVAGATREQLRLPVPKGEALRGAVGADELNRGRGCGASATQIASHNLAREQQVEQADEPAGEQVQERSGSRAGHVG
eukprot:132646-Pelagomonas_calceolata.AAC.7